MQVYKPGSAPEQIFPLQKVVGFGITRAAGKTPPNGLAGFSPGCLFADLDGDIGEKFLINEGTNTSATFNPIGFGDELAATVTEINRVADVSARVHTEGGSTTLLDENSYADGLIMLDVAAGDAITLPAATVGLVYNLFIKTTFVGAASIVTAPATDIFIGHASLGNNSDNTTVDWQSVASAANNTIDLFGTANSTGGIEGQRITLICIAAGVWWVEIRGDAAGTEATPFSHV